MYNFNLNKDEEIIKVFDDVLIRQEGNEKVTTIALTNKRVPFLDYLIENEGLEVLRIARGMNYIKYKEVYYQINLNDIESIIKDKFYKVILKNKNSFEFDKGELYSLLEQVIKQLENKVKKMSVLWQMTLYVL